MKTIISVMRGVWDIPSLVVHKISTTTYMLYVVLTSWWVYPMELHIVMRIVQYMSNREGGTLICEQQENSMKITIKFEVDMDMSD